MTERGDRLRLALDAGRLGDWHWTAETDLVVLSTRAAEIFGLSADRPLPWSAMRNFLQETDRNRAHRRVKRALATHTDYDIEYRISRPWGGECWIAARGRGVYEDDGAIVGMIGVVQDVSARKTAENDLRAALDRERAARSEAERLSAIKDDFLAVLSHELRTPLSAILGWVHIMQHCTDLRAKTEAAGNNTTADLVRGLDVIERNARLQLQLIDDLLDMSRISSGKMRLDVRPLMLQPVIEAAAEMVRPAAETRGIHLELSLDRNVEPIGGDAARLQQIAWNLLSNAIKFTPRGGRVHVRLEQVARQAQLAVVDSGVGIRPDFLEHVFDRFCQGDPSTTRKHGGLGLGLAIVKQLVDAHGGTVVASSAGKDQGASFTVKLPLLYGSEDQANDFRRASTCPLTAADIDFAGVSLVVVDDEADGAAMVARMLREWGAAVRVAYSAEEALALIQREPPDLLVSDIGMPTVDGFELLRRVKTFSAQNCRELPVIALTAFARPEDRERALTAGFAVHFAKPFAPTALAAAIAELAGRSAASRSL